MQVGSIVTPKHPASSHDHMIALMSGINLPIKGDPYVITWIGEAPPPYKEVGLIMALAEYPDGMLFIANNWVELMPPNDIAEVLLEESELVGTV